MLFGSIKSVIEMTPNENFYLNKTEPNKSCFLALRDIILNRDEYISETTKYGMPCFCYKHKMFCYLWVDKKTDEPYILFVEGNRLIHSKLKAGTRSRMKIFPVNPNEDIPVTLISKILDMALDLNRNGTTSL